MTYDYDRRRVAGEKRAVIRKEKGQFCVRSPNNPDWNGGCYDSEEKAKERLRQVEFFKHNKSAKDRLPGGLSDEGPPKDVDPRQVAKGIEVEMEHTDDREIAREIAYDHLTEDPRYYDKLETIEDH